MFVDIRLHIWKRTLHRSCTYARVCAVCSLALGDECGGVQLVYAGHLLMAWGFLLYTLGKIEGLSVSPLFFDGGGSVCGGMCEFAHACTYSTRWVLRVGCELRGRDETLEGPEESKWIQCWHTCICIRVQSTQVYIYDERRDEILDQILFFLNIFFLPKEKSKTRNRDTENSNPYRFLLHRPSIKSTKVLFNVIQAIILYYNRVLRPVNYSLSQKKQKSKTPRKRDQRLRDQ